MRIGRQRNFLQRHRRRKISRDAYKNKLLDSSSRSAKAAFDKLELLCEEGSHNGAVRNLLLILTRGKCKISMNDRDKATPKALLSHNNLD